MADKKKDIEPAEQEAEATQTDVAANPVADDAVQAELQTGEPENTDTQTPADTSETTSGDVAEGANIAQDDDTPPQEEQIPEPEIQDQQVGESADQPTTTDKPEDGSADQGDSADLAEPPVLADTTDNPNAKWYVVHTFSGHENKVATNLKQRIESEHLENRIVDILVPTQDKIEIRGGKKEQVKEKIFPGYILVKMDLDDASWLAVRTTQGVTAFVGMNNKPTPISEREVSSIVKFMTQGAPATFKDVFMINDTVKIVDGPFTDFIGKVESVDKEKGKVRVLVSIFGRETPVELDFLQVTKL